MGTPLAHWLSGLARKYWLRLCHGISDVLLKEPWKLLVILNIHDCKAWRIYWHKMSPVPYEKCKDYVYGNVCTGVLNHTAQLLLKSWFPKSGPTYRRQVVDPRHQTPQGQKHSLLISKCDHHLRKKIAMAKTRHNDIYTDKVIHVKRVLEEGSHLCLCQNITATGKQISTSRTTERKLHKFQ